MREVCYLDVDGVLADCIGGVCKYLKISNPYGDPKMHGVWDFTATLDVDQEKFWSKFGFDFWANLERTPECYGIFEAACKIFGRGNVCLLTAPCESSGCEEGKKVWIRRYLGKVNVLMGTAKALCASPRHLLVDDRDLNIEQFNMKGLGILVPRIWNSMHANQPDDLVEYLTEKMNAARNL